MTNKQTHETYIAAVVEIARKMVANDPEKLKAIDGIKVLYGLGNGGLRGVTYYMGWKKEGWVIGVGQRRTDLPDRQSTHDSKGVSAVTKKDYELIAETIKWQRALFYTTETKTAFKDFAVVLSAKLAIDNPRFDKSKFLKACGVN